MTDEMIQELWLSPEGVTATLEPASWPDDFEWYAEGPGQRPPQFYEMRQGAEILKEFVVFPYEPWSPYDAAVDRLRGDGWTLTNPPEFRTCEHGMNAELCYGPSHYPMDL